MITKFKVGNIIKTKNENVLFNRKVKLFLITKLFPPSTFVIFQKEEERQGYEVLDLTTKKIIYIYDNGFMKFQYEKIN
jgi:hypothetical protein